MANARKHRFGHRAQLPIDVLRVVVIELDPHVVAVDGFDGVERVVLAFQQVIRFDLRAEGFQHDVDAVRAEAFAGVAHVVDVGVEIGVAVSADGDNARHDVHGRAFQGNGVFQRLVDVASCLAFAPRQGGQPPFAVFGIARRAVKKHLLQAVLVQQRFQLGGGIVVGPQVFDVAEARVRRRLEAFEEGAVGKHHGQVGSKFGHGYFPRFFRSLTSSSVR